MARLRPHTVAAVGLAPPCVITRFQAPRDPEHSKINLSGTEDARYNAVAIDVLSFSPINFCRTDGTNAAHGDKIPVFRK